MTHAYRKRGVLPDNLWSLGDMIEMRGRPLMGAIAELREFIALIRMIPEKDAPVGDEDRNRLLAPHMNRLMEALTQTSARLALLSARRLKARIDTGGAPLTYNEALFALIDIESRFADHLDSTKLLMLSEHEAALFEPVQNLLSFAGEPQDNFASNYPSAAFEIEESAKCVALGRHTASAFHSMRAAELGIRALAAYLGIPDPVKTADRNWGEVLRQINAEMDKRYPKNKRLTGTEGARLESIVVTLDAIKNPWRNNTMHVETIYAPHEAIHIARCTAMFMLEIAKIFDEEGKPISTDSGASLAAE